MKVRAPEGNRRGLTDEEHYLLVKTGKTIGDYGLIEKGDRILVALSGGPASFAMRHLLELHRSRFLGGFELLSLHVGDEESATAGLIRKAAGKLGAEVQFVLPPPSLDRPPRRGESKAAAYCRRIGYFLRRRAVVLGCNKLAIGHTLDDQVRIFLHRMLNEARLSALPPTERGRDGLVVIRPLLEVGTKPLVEICRQLGFEPATNGYKPADEAVEWLLSAMREHNPRLERSILASLKNVRLTHLMLPESER